MYAFANSGSISASLPCGPERIELLKIDPPGSAGGREATTSADC